MERHETLVLGAGPSGLAVAGALAQRDRPCLVIDRAEAVGASWRNHYARLHLHTHRDHSHLPGMRFPRGTPKYVPRADVVAYLDAYAERFAVDTRLGETVTEARNEGEGWTVTTDADTYAAPNLVVATGYNRTPKWPAWARDEPDFSGTLVHSHGYHDGAPFRGQRVLVVGIGNSGGEIALDLWEHGAREVAICVRGPVRVLPRDFLGLSAQEHALLIDKLPRWLGDRVVTAVQRVAFEDLSAYGLVAPEISAREQVERLGKVPLIDVGVVELIKQGAVEVVGDVEHLDGEAVVFGDGTRRPFDAIVCATGYRASLGDFLPDADALTDDRGYPRVHGAEAAPGLYFCGYANPVTGALRESAIEAERIADAIARH